MIIPIFPAAELIDRYTIAQIKQERTNKNSEELEFYSSQIEKFEIGLIADLLAELKSIHESIWDLEADLKQGKEQNISFDELGRRAVEIRDFNSKRLKVKNKIAKLLGCKIREIKHDHLSE